MSWQGDSITRLYIEHWEGRPVCTSFAPGRQAVACRRVPLGDQGWQCALAKDDQVKKYYDYGMATMQTTSMYMMAGVVLFQIRSTYLAWACTLLHILLLTGIHTPTGLYPHVQYIPQ